VNDKLFIPQSVLDNWVESGKVVFNDNVLTLTRENKAYTLTSAVRFLKLIDGDDKAKLLGRLRTIEKLTELGAEHMSDSVILGDTAYEVQEGFIAVVLADEQVASAAETALPAVVPPPPEPAKVTPPAALTQAPMPPNSPPPVEMTATPGTEGSSTDADLLTKFLLNNLNF
jgi:hypothetical protein